MRSININVYDTYILTPWNIYNVVFKDTRKKWEYPASLIGKVIHQISYKERFLVMDKKPPAAAPYIANKGSPTTPIAIDCINPGNPLAFAHTNPTIYHTGI